MHIALDRFIGAESQKFHIFIIDFPFIFILSNFWYFSIDFDCFFYSLYFASIEL